MSDDARADLGLLTAIRERLYTAVLSDVLDELGHREQALPPFIRPLDDTLVLAGFARTGLYREVDQASTATNPYALEIALIDDLAPGDVAVLACGGSSRIAPWGELLTTASRARGAAGCVTDGYVRDIRQIRGLRFPVFHAGIAPLDSKGRGEMTAMDVPVRLAGVAVAPGDVVVGDADGVVIVPRAIAADAVQRALTKVEREDHTREALAAGATLAEVFAKYGVL
jgi:regulator of RNase E activity RraA